MNTVSLFCGAGGESMGKHLAFEELGYDVRNMQTYAVNHWDLAVAVHSRNFPWVRVIQEDITKVTARDFGLKKINLLWASPSCVHHSRARGGKPREEQQRAHAWEVVDRWLRVAQVDVLLVENVPEFAEWGPLDESGQVVPARKGEFFRAFVEGLRELGYQVEWRILCAADYGDPTTRQRLFLQAVRDGRGIVWPDPTHRDPRKPVGFFNHQLPAWRTAASCIDWSIPVPSIFDRKKPLAEATLRRIAAGVVRYILKGKPFIVNFRGTSPSQLQASASGLDEPIRTVSAGGIHHALVAAFLAKHYGGVVGQGLERPLGTVTAVDHHSLVAANIIEIGNKSSAGVWGANHPLTTTTTKARHALTAAFIQHYYGTGGQHHDPGQPLHTITTLARHGLVTVEIDGETYVISDIGMRMLEPHELALAMGFPEGFEWETADGRHITKRDKIRMIGNACPVGTVKELIKAVVLRKQVNNQKIS